MIDVDPVQVRYLPVKNALQKIKKYTVDKPDEYEEGTSNDIYDRLFGTEGGDK